MAPAADAPATRQRAHVDTRARPRRLRSPTARRSTSPFEQSPTPIDVGAIPNFDRPRDPTPSSRVEELARCLSYRASLDPTFSSTSRVRLKITATSTCAFWVPTEESGFEVVSKPVAGGGIVAREVGQFQSAIPPRSSHAETVIEIDCPAPAGGCRYEVSVYSPGGGTSPQ